MSTLGLGREHRKQYGNDMAYISKLRAEDSQYISDLQGVLMDWYNNPYLREFIATPGESRAVAKEVGQISAGVEEGKRSVRETASRQRLGKAFAAKSEQVVAAAGEAQKQASRMAQAQQSIMGGMQAEQTLASGKGQIETEETRRKQERDSMEHGAKSALIAGDERKAAAGGKLGMAALGAAAGGIGAGMGADGLTAMQGAQLGANVGNMFGQGDIGGAMGAWGQGVALGGMSRPGGQQGNMYGFSPINATGYNPLLSLPPQMLQAIFGGGGQQGSNQGGTT